MIDLELSPWPTACLQVYTGNGKGKTTAAFGLALRAAGRGLNVYIGQFMKKTSYGEVVAATWLKNRVKVEQFGSPECIPWRETPDAEDEEQARRGLAKSRFAMLSGEYSIIILDEINVAVHFRLITEKDLLDLVDLRPQNVELVCTGRYALESLCKRADLVTEMQEKKHPYREAKLQARDGIER